MKTRLTGLCAVRSRMPEWLSEIKGSMSSWIPTVASDAKPAILRGNGMDEDGSEYFLHCLFPTQPSSRVC